MADFIGERRKVADACRLLVDRGFFAGTGGNIGLRVADGFFAVTPSATEYSTMQAHDVAVLRLDTLEQVEGDRPASVERGLHAAMLRAYPARPASIHTHQPVASALALLHRELPWPPGFDRDLLGLRAGLVPYRPSGTGMLVKALSGVLSPGVFVYLLASHGLILAGPTLDDGIAMAGRVEAAAARHLRELIAGNPGAAGALRGDVLGYLDAIATEER